MPCHCGLRKKHGGQRNNLKREDRFMSYREISTDTIVKVVLEGVEKKMIIEDLEAELIQKENEIKEQEEKHKKIARVTFPVWIYVAVTGIAVHAILYHIY